MADKAARPFQVAKSDKLETLKRMKRDFAVRPYALSSGKWHYRLVTSAAKHDTRDTEEAREKKLIRDATKGIKGVEFPAAELAKIIRGWMAQDES